MYHANVKDVRMSRLHLKLKVYPIKTISIPFVKVELIHVSGLRFYMK